MAKDIVVLITTNVSTFITTTKGQGCSMSLSGASAGTFNLQKKLPDGTLINVTDDVGNAIAITILPTTINLFVGDGADITVLPSGIAGTLVVTALPLTASV